LLLSTRYLTGITKRGNEMKSHKDLDVWKRSVDLVTTIYKHSKNFPKDEIYGLTNQIRRAAVSVPSNIAEGAARKSSKEFVQYLYIALGSIAELETQILIGKNLNYLLEDEFNLFQKEITEIRKMILGLIRFLSNKK